MLRKADAYVCIMENSVSNSSDQINHSRMLRIGCFTCKALK